MRRRGLALAALVAGLALVTMAQRLAPVQARPLYDGVVVFDPYKWLAPPPGLLGGAQPAQQTFSGLDLEGGFATGTPEQPPQAQVQGTFDALAVRDGTSAVTISLDPVATPTTSPPNGIVAGNVYEVELKDQYGNDVEPESGATVTVVLRGPTSLPEATIETYSDGQWTPLQTDWPGVPDTFVASVSQFGEFALVAPSNWVPTGEVATPPPAPTAAASGEATATEAVAAETPTAGNEASPAAQSGAPTGPIVGIGIALVALVAAVVGLLLLGRPPGNGSGR